MPPRQFGSSDSKPRPVSWGLVAFVLVAISLLVYFEMRHQSIEDQLRFRESPPGNAGEEIALPASTGQRVYVPAYSHIYGLGGKPYLLETTLSVRNTDIERPITISSVRYYDTDGKLVREYLSSPRRLAPLATGEFLVESEDIRGGSGANFIVEWSAADEVNEPMIEAVMVAIGQSTSFSFARRGRVLPER
jgi:hypothetical protein